VILVSGPTVFNVDHSLIKLINVVSAQEMYDVCHQYFNEVDVVIARSVSDYKPKHVATQKIKIDR
jgi:phosphopantothenoylcysteine decarboxylase/phosphopantothenate--cysteine ligase